MENFSVTENAAGQIKKILEQEAPGSMLRISVQGGGCSGFSYSFSIDDTATLDDKQFTRNDIVVLVDELSLQYMDGAEIDWVDDLMRIEKFSALQLAYRLISDHFCLKHGQAMSKLGLHLI